MAAQGWVRSAKSSLRLTWQYFFLESADRVERQVQVVFRHIGILRRVLEHPLVPMPAKLVAVCCLAYPFSPIQLIPSFIPLLGQLDDVAVLWLGLKLVRRLVPVEVLRSCEHAEERPALATPALRFSD